MAPIVDALVVVPPLSPSDTNPPLGPYILKSAFARAGLLLEVADLSIRYINRFKSKEIARMSPLLGDQDKDRNATHAARNHFLAQCNFSDEAALQVPSCSNAVLGMHYSFESIDRAVERACQSGSFWSEFFEQELLASQSVPPRIVGLSIMGPPQAFLALVVARLVKRRWPQVLIVAGGSHITLLIDDIAADSRYGRDIDLFMPRHCEKEFTSLALALKQNDSSIFQFGVRAGQGSTSSHCANPRRVIPMTINGQRGEAQVAFDYLPLFDRASLVDYDPSRVTIPMQLTRGCIYGKCTYCTYPAIEQERDATPDWPRAIQAILELVQRTGVHRISFKDSLFSQRSLREMASRLNTRGIRIEWSATTLLNTSLTPELFRTLYKSGCRTLEFGLESIDADGQALFNKSLDMEMVEQVIESSTQAGIAIVLNQIFGWPGQSQESADRQVEWYERIRARHCDLVSASFNLLEVNRMAPMSQTPEKYGIVLDGVAPWAFSYKWNAPAWRESWQIPSDETEVCA